MNQEKRFIVDVLFVLTLFGVFTVSALILVTIGAEVYRHTVDDMGTNYETRTSVAYITEKLRQNDNLISDGTDSAENSISISTLSGEPALMLTQDIDGETYCTYLYLYDGHLKELFIKSGSFSGDNIPDAGQNIMELSALNMDQVSDNLISIQLVTPAGETHRMFVSTHCVP